MRSRGTAGRAGRLRRRTVSIRALLVALVCLPVAAVAFSGAQAISGRLSTARDAGREASAIRLIGQVDSARATAQSLILPGLAVAVASHPAIAAQLGFARSDLPALAAAFPAAPFTRTAADATAQLAAIDRRRVPAPEAQLIRQLLAEYATTAADTTARPVQIIPDYTVQASLLQQLGVVESQVSEQLGGTVPAGGGQVSVSQLGVVVSLAQWGDNELPAYLGTVLGVQPQAYYRTNWLQTWASYRSAVAAADSGLHGTLASAWRAIEAAPTTRAFDTAVDSSAGGAPAAAGVPAVLTLAAASQPRSAALSHLLEQAVEQASATAGAERSAASAQVWWAAAETGGLILSSIGLALLVGRAVARPVRRLAHEADRIRSGDLVEIVPGGPAEVRRAGEALAATSASLRRVEAQAAELAAGRLDSPLLRAPLPGPLGEVVHHSVTRIIEAIHERERLQGELAHQAAHDPLTALPNRAAALQHIEAAIARSARAEQILGLLFVDLDDFKGVNDSFGHAAGDRTLQVIAGRMQDCVRAGDTVCRLGGDEFLVVVEDAESELAIVETAHRMVTAICAPLAVGGVEVAVGASIGVAVDVDAHGTAEALLAEADAAVYRAKQSGRCRVEVFDDQLRDTLCHRADVERGIREGLGRGEFSLVYQPVVDVSTDTVHSHEALIRWNRPGHGLVMPADFIPIAESSGLINELGRWALHEAADQARRWTDDHSGEGPLPAVAVNVSGRQLASAQLLDDVRDALARSGIAPAQLTLELTESVLVADFSSIDRLHALKALGVRIALDDFGTGYTSIGQLGRFPIDILKIDRSFVAMLASSDKLVQTMIQVAHTFSLDVIAEGVEDPDQLAMLRLLDCDAVQGYLLARPGPASSCPGQNTPWRPTELLTGAVTGDPAAGHREASGATP
jgi:diguanylate cyclase (GGDEF)-like protein